jgi:Uncharacterized conserved protein
MFYAFPANLTLEEVRNVIRKHNERIGAVGFCEIVKDGYTAFDYVVAFADSFPQPVDDDPQTAREYAILRECRGLLMDQKTGQVLARRYHKFFNVNEKEFTQAHLIDWSADHVILDKLDGSMISPFRVTGENRIRWGTRKGETEISKPVVEFVEERRNYEAFAAAMIDRRVTPIFEWCSPQQRIVIEYRTDNLILTGIRDNLTGQYWSYEDMTRAAWEYDIPIVTMLPGMVKKSAEYLERVRKQKGVEGVIIRFRNGHMVKIKTEEYCIKHKAIDALSLEKNVWQLVLSDSIDDFLSTLPEEDRAIVERFQDDIKRELILEGQRYERIVERARRACRDSKKKFATEWLKMNMNLNRQIAFQVWDGSRGYDAIRSYVKKNCNSASKVEQVRPLLNFISWNDYRKSYDE